ncbi:MAG: hypothetical protein MUO26_05330 [Methanotrichaceae archaeon]|nr:hypothetical protein [Methanotrichaceae archaeon]
MSRMERIFAGFQVSRSGAPSQMNLEKVLATMKNNVNRPNTTMQMARI